GGGRGAGLKWGEGRRRGLVVVGDPGGHFTSPDRVAATTVDRTGVAPALLVDGPTRRAHPRGRADSLGVLGCAVAALAPGRIPRGAGGHQRCRGRVHADASGVARPVPVSPGPRRPPS